MAADKRAGIKRSEALACIPEKNGLVEEERVGTGDIILSCPQTYKPLFRRLRRLVGRSAESTFIRRIQLDSLGADVWGMIDGKRDVLSIVKAFAALHGMHVREAEISVTLFIKSLGEKGLIGLKGPR